MLVIRVSLICEFQQVVTVIFSEWLKDQNKRKYNSAKIRANCILRKNVVKMCDGDTEPCYILESERELV